MSEKLITRSTCTERFSVTLTLRIYALYGRSRRLLSCILIIGFALLGGACVRVRTYFFTVDLAYLSRRALFLREIIHILWFTSREMIVIIHSQ